MPPPRHCPACVIVYLSIPIPEGKQGTVLLPKTAEVAPPSVFSHCSLVQAIAVEEGSAAFASENGLLYDASLTTLLRVPAGATNIVIREGCTTIAAGAMEACASLATITAPASVTSISPDVFTSVPTVSLPAAALTEDAPQLTALVALSSTLDSSVRIDLASVSVTVCSNGNIALWERLGVKATSLEAPIAASVGTASTYSTMGTVYVKFSIASSPTAYAYRQTPYITSFVACDSEEPQYILEAESYAFINQRLEIYNSRGTWAFACDSAGGGVTSVWNAAGYHLTHGVTNPVSHAEETLFLDPMSYTITWNPTKGSCSPGTTTLPASQSVVAPTPKRTGYRFDGWYTTASNGDLVCAAGESTPRVTKDVTYYAHWTLRSYDIVYDLDKGIVSGNPTAYNVTTATFTLKNPTRTGYIFTGWSGTGLTGEANMTVTVPKGSTGNRSYTAHWMLAISADVPFEVTARVDLLGIEDQEEAAGYIESRCGEALTVADVAFEPLAGATDVFGAASVADVALEVLAAGSTSPDARFALDASASQAPASASAFRMASYGTRIPISYRFDIPDELLSSLVETEKPVCSVAYTVALA